MKKAAPIIVILIILVVVGIVLANHNSNNSNSGYNSTSSNSQASNSHSSSQAVATNSVTISNFAFSPASITVKKGTTVTWTNKDAVAHTVTETDGKNGPGSSDLNQNQTYDFTYNTVGSFKYHCSIHPNMLGTVTVTD